MNVETTKWRRDAIDDVVLDEEALARARKRRRIIIVSVILLVIVAIVAVFAMGGRGEKAGDAKAPAAKQGGSGSIPSVSFVVPGRQQMGRTITATGSLAAIRDLPVGVPGEGGQVVRVLVEPGQWVGAGQVLAVIDRQVQVQEAAQLRANIAVAQADLRIAQQNLQRGLGLVARQFISRADIDRLTATRDAAAARVSVAQAQYRGANARIGRLDVRAPAAGLVLSRTVEAGQIVGGSGVLFRIAEGGRMELQARLPQDELARLSVGQVARVTPVGSQQSYQAQLWQSSPIIDPSTRQGIARFAIPYNAELRPGGFAEAVMETGNAVAPVLPESAVLSDAAGNFVYIIDGNSRVQRRNVQLGEVNDRGMQIRSGLNGDERVVLSAGAFLAPNQQVRPERAQMPQPGQAQQPQQQAQPPQGQQAQQQRPAQ